MNAIKKIFFNKQFSIFLVIGGINTFNGSLFAFLYSIFLQVNLAFILGYVSALFIAYILNSLFVFKAKPSFVKMLKFALSYIPNFFIQNGVVFILYNMMGLWSMIAYVVAAIAGIPITFLILKLFTFKEEEK